MKTEIEALISTGAIIHGVVLPALEKGSFDRAISLVAETDEDRKRVKECLKQVFQDAESSCVWKARHLEPLGERLGSKPGSEIALDQRRPKRKW